MSTFFSMSNSYRRTTKKCVTCVDIWIVDQGLGSTDRRGTQVEHGENW